jgi:L-aminopeptidase/D-esterase-like protein
MRGLPTGIQDVEGLEVGHHTASERPTGCTVILAREGAVAGCDVRGGAPGTREVALLDPVNTVDRIHGVFLSGGSAFGLDVGSGVVRYLDERGIGFRVGDKVVPIVVGAILYDLGLEGDRKVRPGSADGYQAARAAGTGPLAEGSVGAGAGATVGKLLGTTRAMKGGFGTAALRSVEGWTVAAAAAVNAIGDVVDPTTARVVAGVRSEDGRSLADARTVLRGMSGPAGGAPGGNTTLAVVATDATLTKVQATKVAQMAQDGLARTIYPAHTPNDGDTVFALATCRRSGPADMTLLGALAAEVLAEAVLRAVRTADGLPGLPSVRELDGV